LAGAAHGKAALITQMVTNHQRKKKGKGGKGGKVQRLLFSAERVLGILWLACNLVDAKRFEVKITLALEKKVAAAATCLLLSC